jgi:hypothetical protein
MKDFDKGGKSFTIPNMNDTRPSKALGVGLRPERFIDKFPIKGGSLNEVMSCGSFLSNAKHRWSKETSTRLAENAKTVAFAALDITGRDGKVFLKEL